MITILAALMLIATGCDKIEDPHKPITPSGGNKTVLIKDFTGARCVNCPAAAEHVHELQHQLGEDRIIILSVHAGDLAQPLGQFPDFTTEEGEAWYNNNASNPLFTVDHVALTEGNTLGIAQIDSPVGTALGETQLFEISISNAFDMVSRRLTVESRINATGDGQGQYYASVCLVEDSIVGLQKVPRTDEFPNGVNPEYVFRNVFRGSLNGMDGQLAFNGSYYYDDSFDTTCSIELDSTYNADQCYILTYIYDKADGKILQTAIEKIK